MKLPFILFFVVFTKLGFAQSDLLTKHQIDSIVSSIDSTKGLIDVVVDGFIRPKGKRKPKGGFSEIYFINKATNHLQKLERGAPQFYSDFTTYYFFKDNLILVNTIRKNINDRTNIEISSGKYYFRNGELIDRQENGNPLSKPEAFLTHAKMYITDVKTLLIKK